MCAWDSMFCVERKKGQRVHTVSDGDVGSHLSDSGTRNAHRQAHVRFLQRGRVVRAVTLYMHMLEIQCVHTRTHAYTHTHGTIHQLSNGANSPKPRRYNSQTYENTHHIGILNIP